MLESVQRAELWDELFDSLRLQALYREAVLAGSRERSLAGEVISAWEDRVARPLHYVAQADDPSVSSATPESLSARDEAHRRMMARLCELEAFVEHKIR